MTGVQNILYARTIFATHYHELNQLERLNRGVYNNHVEVKEEGDYYVIPPFFWNSYIENGNFISFGIIGQGTAPRTITYEFVK